MGLFLNFVNREKKLYNLLDKTVIPSQAKIFQACVAGNLCIHQVNHYTLTYLKQTTSRAWHWNNKLIYRYVMNNRSGSWDIYFYNGLHIQVCHKIVHIHRWCSWCILYVNTDALNI